MNHATDDALLDRLAGALAPAPAEPSAASVAHVRELVTHESWPTAGVMPIPTRLSRLGRHMTAVAAAVAAIVLVSAAAFAAGVPMPRPVRTVAYSIGMPVDSPALSDAKDAANTLREALQGDDLREIERAAAVLRERLDALDQGERAEVRGAGALLAAAERRLTPSVIAPTGSPALAAPQAATGASSQLPAPAPPQELPVQAPAFLPSTPQLEDDQGEGVPAAPPVADGAGNTDDAGQDAPDDQGEQ